MSAFLDSASDLAPTATVLLQKEKVEIQYLKDKMEWQKERIEELEQERDFHQGQLTSLRGTYLDLNQQRS